MTDWYKIKRVLTWVNWEEKQIYPAGWTPNANTVAYYPLTSNFNDASWNSRNLTNSWATIWTYWWVTCAYYDWWDYSYYSWYWLNSPRTICLRWYNTNTTGWYYWWLIHISQYSNNTPSWSLGLQYIWSSIITPADWSSSSAEIQTSITSWWHNIVVTEDSSRTVTLYIDGVSKWTKSYSSPATPDWWSLWSKFVSTFSERLRWYLSKVILENKAWTAQEVALYYNQTKSTYGL